MTLLDSFARVRKDLRCPVCGRADWCMVSRDDPPSKCICKRSPSPRPWGEAGWLHRLRDDGQGAHPRVRQIKLEARCTSPNLGDAADRYREAVQPESLARHAMKLGLSVGSLRRLGIGWTPRAWLFPMTGTDGRVCGIRFRAWDGAKWSERGGKEGLFVPAGLDASRTLAVAEGPTDTAALLDLGMEAVGRPSCTGGVRLLVLLVKAHRPAAVAIFADADGPGQRGAGSLATVLATYCRDVRVVTPPAKDARVWLGSGASKADALVLVDSAAPLRVAIRVQRSLP